MELNNFLIGVIPFARDRDVSRQAFAEEQSGMIHHIFCMVHKSADSRTNKRI